MSFNVNLRSVKQQPLNLSYFTICMECFFTNVTSVMALTLRIKLLKFSLIIFSFTLITHVTIIKVQYVYFLTSLLQSCAFKSNIIVT